MNKDQFINKIKSGVEKGKNIAGKVYDETIISKAANSPQGQKAISKVKSGAKKANDFAVKATQGIVRPGSVTPMKGAAERGEKVGKAIRKFTDKLPSVQLQKKLEKAKKYDQMAKPAPKAPKKKVYGGGASEKLTNLSKGLYNTKTK